MPDEYRYIVSATDGDGNQLPLTVSDVAGWPVTEGRYTEVWPPIDRVYACTSTIYTYPPCRVYWGSHGCMHPRGHGADMAHACDCCECGQHPDEGSGCVARPPYYGEHTRYYGEDAEVLGLPLTGDQ